MRTRGTLRLATRGSTFARRQASLVKEALENRRYEVELVTVETTGDQIRDELIHRVGKTGASSRCACADCILSPKCSIGPPATELRNWV